MLQADSLRQAHYELLTLLVFAHFDRTAASGEQEASREQKVRETSTEQYAPVHEPAGPLPDDSPDVAVEGRGIKRPLGQFWRGDLE